MAACGRVPWIKILNRQKVCGCSCWSSSRYASQQTDVAEVKEFIPRGQVTIPMKKKRDSLSILKALSSTVDYIKGVPYNVIDDPNLMSNKKDAYNCYLAKAAGQKAARYFVNKYSNAFDHEDMAPFVQAFQPDQLEYEFTNLCDEAILERVQRREVTKAVEVYEKMKQQGIKVSEEVKLELLELMCVYGSKDPPEKRLPLEMIISLTQEKHQPFAATLANDVYNDLEEKTDDAKNWMIQYHLKDAKGELAIQMYKEMKANKVPVNRYTYHCMLVRATIFANLTGSKVHESVLSIFQEMADAGIQPNLETFNSAITGFTRVPFFFLDFFPAIMAEMKELEIVAQMAQYIRDAVEHMKEHPEEIFCNTKGHFFMFAMNICHYLQDPELAILVNNFKDSLGSKYVVVNINKEDEYYLHLFDLLNRTEACQTILDIYNRTYGQLWTDQEIFIKVLITIETFKEYQYLPMLFEDYMSRSPRYPDNSIMEAFFYMMSLPGHSEELNKYFKEAADHTFALTKQFFSPDRKMTQLKANWDVHTHMINIFINNDDLETAWECLMLCFKNQDQVDRLLWNPSLHNLLEAIIDKEDQEKLDMFVSVADMSMNHSVDINAYRPRLETFMSKEDIDALETGQQKRIKEKYDL